MKAMFHPDYGTLQVEELHGYLGNRQRAAVLVSRTLGRVWILVGETWKAVICGASPSALALFGFEVAWTLMRLGFRAQYIHVPAGVDNVKWRRQGELPS